MSRRSNRTKAQAAWTQFWSQAASAPDHRFRDGQTSHVLRSHWAGIFDQHFHPGASVSVLDAACGEGELVRLAHNCAGPVENLDLKLHCTDIAPAAVAAAAGAVATDAVLPVVADSAALPFATASFDCVVSQFGLEYAGEDAFADAARVTAADGGLHALVHRRGGAIEQECVANLALLDAVRDSGLLRRLDRLVAIAARHAVGKAAPAALQRAMQALATALDAVGEVLRGAAPGAARTLLTRLWQDCSTVAGRAGHYAPGELETWLAAHGAELDAYAHRMRSMIAAARDDSGIAVIVRNLEAGGLPAVAIDEVRGANGQQSLAWSISARTGP
ncbi:methyltransferase domain-containing protein [Maricaulis maris]|uniref:Methyltransferase family protein n=1 Tax=Maricaulis maris TaxID=74318 RepID=A0A495DKS9_9PROT|nr:methyltransferase domain-containing protein [Maricaulis maris]RKR03211.1 methyltransferase family protein [Maricaulis maris]